jgi:hypothetical protein
MVKIEILVNEGKVRKIQETELGRYVEFFSESYKDNLGHAESNTEKYPRWAIISGYYAMHDVSKLLIAKIYRFKIEREVHATTIKVLRELIKDEETVKLLEDGYEEFQELGDELAEAKKERVKVQYYTGSRFLKEKYKEKAKIFFDNTVKPFIGKILKLLGENDN